MIHFDNSYARLPQGFFARTRPTPVSDAFGVPAGCEWGGGKRQAMNGRSLFVCEVFWREG